MVAEYYQDFVDRMNKLITIADKISLLESAINAMIDDHNHMKNSGKSIFTLEIVEMLQSFLSDDINLFLSDAQKETINDLVILYNMKTKSFMDTLSCFIIIS